MAIHQKKAWHRGWLAIKETIHWDYKDKDEDPEGYKSLEELASLIRPTTLEDKVYCFVVSLKPYHKPDVFINEIDQNLIEDRDRGDANDELMRQYANYLGRECANYPEIIEKCAQSLFEEPDSHNFYSEFFHGLASESKDPLSLWAILDKVFVGCFENKDTKHHINLSPLVGFISGLSKDFQDEVIRKCSKNKYLFKYICILLPTKDFDEEDFALCIEAFDTYGKDCQRIGDLVWREQYVLISEDKKIALLQKIFDKDCLHEFFEALDIKINVSKKRSKKLPDEYKRLGLLACKKLVREEQLDHEYLRKMKEFLDFCFEQEGMEKEKECLFDVLVDKLEEKSRESSFYFRRSITSILLRYFTPDEIVRYCKESEDECQSWFKFASAIKVFEDKQGKEFISDQARAILENASNPRDVVRCFQEQLYPFDQVISVESEAGIIKGRIEALTKLLPHRRKDVDDAIREILPKAEELLKEVCERDNQRFTAEQRFDY